MENEKREAHQSFWELNVPKLSFNPLTHDISTDVLVIGAGLTGLSIAYQLAKTHREVIVVDSYSVGSGDTARTTAHLTNVIDYDYQQIKKWYGEENAKKVLKSHRQAIDQIESIVNEEKIDCDFKRIPGYIFLKPGESREGLEKELETYHQLDFKDVHMLEEAPLSTFKTGPTLRFANQAEFHPLKYLKGLIAFLLEHHVPIYTDTHIQKVDTHEAITDSGYKIKAKNVVVATHSPVKNILFFLKEAAYRSYVVGSKIPKGYIPSALFWDREDPYHYIRTQSFDNTSDLLIVGGEDHKTGQMQDSEKAFQKLEHWTRSHFPLAKEFEYRWSGQIIEPIDGLAYIGKSPYRGKHLYIATGYSGNGMTYATIAGTLISDLINEKENEFASLYNPTRKKIQSVGSFLEENLNVISKLVTDWIKKDDKSISDLHFGEGAIIQKGLKKIAVYKDSNDEIHAYSAICPHLGCIVQWNSAEKTFDCPCHGSRFTCHGEVINGPAIRNLALASDLGTTSESEEKHHVQRAG